MSLDFSSPKSTIFRASGAGRKLSNLEEKEVELVQWVLEQRDLQLAVTVQNIVDQAVAVIQPTRLSRAQGGGHRNLCGETTRS